MSDLALRQSSFLLPEQLAQLGPEKHASGRKFVENKKIPAGPWKTFLWHSRCKLNSQKPDKNKTSQDHLRCCLSVLEPAKTMNRSPLNLKDSIIGKFVKTYFQFQMYNSSLPPFWHTFQQRWHLWTCWVASHTPPSCCPSNSVTQSRAQRGNYPFFHRRPPSLAVWKSK